MPTINTVSLDLSNRNLGPLEAWLDELSRPLLYNAPTARNHAHIASLVLQSSRQAVFRIEDDPRIVCVWQHHNTAAVVFTLWRRTLRCIDMIFVGDSTNLGSQWVVTLGEAEIKRIQAELRPLLVRCSVRNGCCPIADVLGILVYMPVMCDIHGID